MTEVLTDSKEVQVNYTVRGPSREAVYDWLRTLYRDYPSGKHATSHSEPRQDRGRWVTFASRFV